jgi:hypothetical protein
MNFALHHKELSTVQICVRDTELLEDSASTMIASLIKSHIILWYNVVQLVFYVFVCSKSIIRHDFCNVIRTRKNVLHDATVL